MRQSVQLAMRKVTEQPFWAHFFDLIIQIYIYALINSSGLLKKLGRKFENKKYFHE